MKPFSVTYPRLRISSMRSTACVSPRPVSRCRSAIPDPGESMPNLHQPSIAGSMIERKSGRLRDAERTNELLDGREAHLVRKALQMRLPISSRFRNPHKRWHLRCPRIKRSHPTKDASMRLPSAGLTPVRPSPTPGAQWPIRTPACGQPLFRDDLHVSASPRPNRLLSPST